MGKNKIEPDSQAPKEVCGIIMPISASDGYGSEHWIDVKLILFQVIRESGFEPNLVSDADEVGIIHSRIISNIYNNPIMICDVSSKNPNVMFELGLRLAFDRPTIIIKDSHTSYNFDTSPIEHLGYPKDLRYTTMTDFKEKLKTKILATHRAWQKDPNYSTFLKEFVQYKAKLEVKEISGQEFILKQLEAISSQIADLSKPVNLSNHIRGEQSVIKPDLGTEREYSIIYEGLRKFLQDISIEKKETYRDNLQVLLNDFIKSVPIGSPNRTTWTTTKRLYASLMIKELAREFGLTAINTEPGAV